MEATLHHVYMIAGVSFDKHLNTWLVATLSTFSSCFQVQKLLSDGGAAEERYMSETITHAIADDCESDDYSEARELFELTVVTVS